MSRGYGNIWFRDVDGDDEAVREAARDLCSLLAQSNLDFDIEIDLQDITNQERRYGSGKEERDWCTATWTEIKLCDCEAHDGSVCWECDKTFMAGTCIICEMCGGKFCEACQDNSCKGLGKHNDKTLV